MAAPAYPIFPERSEDDQLKAIAKLLSRPGAHRLVGADGKPQQIPETLHRLLVQIVAGMQDGKGVSVIPAERELTTSAAARLLGMSRQYFVRMLDAGAIPFHRTGTHRRVQLKDLLEYQKKRDHERHESIGAMARKELAEGTYDAFILPDQE
jgi:excisionase family DNA binding protein